MNEDDLKRRTKQFALRIMKLVGLYRRPLSDKSSENSCFDRRPPSVPITARLVGVDRRPSLWRSLVSSSKSQTSAVTGWN